MDDLSSNPDIISLEDKSKSFIDFQLKSNLQSALKKLNFIHPTPIQSQTIPIILQNKNVIAQAKAGTGKTLAFVSTLLTNIEIDSIFLEGLIIVPTRELAIQIYNFINLLSKNMTEKNSNHISTALCIGGLPIQDDKNNLKKNKINIVVGTLGRICELIKKEILKMEFIKVIIFDEADKLLSKENDHNIKLILSKKKKECQILAFSATFSERNLNKMKEISINYEVIQTSKNSEMGENLIIEDQLNKKRTFKEFSLNLMNLLQYYIICTEEKGLNLYQNKTKKLLEILKTIEYFQSIIFYNEKNRGYELSTDLKAEGLDNCFIHGDQTQSDRIKIMNKLQLNKTKIIVSSDLLSRGIDINTIDLVINFDVPNSLETYFHRIGRTGRFGNFGISIIFVTPKEKIDFLEKFQNDIQIEEFKFENIIEFNQKLNKKERKIDKFQGFFDNKIISGWKNLAEEYYDENDFKYFPEKKIKKEEENPLIHKHSENKNNMDFLNCETCYEFLKKSETFLNRKFEILDMFTIKGKK